MKGIAASFFVTACLLAAFTLPASAQIVINGGAPNQKLVYIADSNYEFTTAATAFQASSAVTFNEISWWGGYVPGSPATDDFTMTIYADVGGVIGTALDTVDLGSGSPTLTGGSIVRYSPELAEYSYRDSFAPINLSSGNYFLALSRSGGAASTYWGWESTSGGAQLGGASYCVNSSGCSTYVYGWNYISSENLAFNLSDTAAVPEPSTYALLLGGLGLIGLVARRRQAVQQSPVCR